MPDQLAGPPWNAPSDKGWCVGDEETHTPLGPAPDTFDTSPFSVGRGFDLIVPRESMVIRYSSSHGSPSGNDNLTGQDLLTEIQAILQTL